MSWCDLAVCRAGAMTLSELAAAGRPALLVPLASSTHGHQLENARAFAARGRRGRSWRRRTSRGVARRGPIAGFSRTRPAAPQWAQQARRLAHPDAARRLADLLFSIERAAA